jgi:hypothetical protein
MVNRLLFFLLLLSTLRAQQLDGVVDVHVHSDPDSMPRSIDAIEVCRIAKQHNMRALVLKNHFEPTASLAWLAAKLNPGIEVFGGIALNLTVGGINPAAVERMTRVVGGRGRVVWMPTFDSENHVRQSGEDRPFVPVARNGVLLPEVIEVLRLIASHDLLLATGHLSPQESLLLIREAKRLGVKRILVTHAIMPPIRMSVEQMKEAAKEGAFIEFVANDVIGPRPLVPVTDCATAIRAVGAENCILASDLGQPANPLHPEGLQILFKELRRLGIGMPDIERMSKLNPAGLLSLSD